MVELDLEHTPAPPQPGNLATQLCLSTPHPGSSVASWPDLEAAAQKDKGQDS